MEITLERDVQLIQYLSSNAIFSDSGKRVYCFYKKSLLVASHPIEMKELLNLAWR